MPTIERLRGRVGHMREASYEPAADDSSDGVGGGSGEGRRPASWNGGETELASLREEVAAKRAELAALEGRLLEAERSVSSAASGAASGIASGAASRAGSGADAGGDRLGPMAPAAPRLRSSKSVDSQEEQSGRRRARPSLPNTPLSGLNPGIIKLLKNHPAACSGAHAPSASASPSPPLASAASPPPAPRTSGAGSVLGAAGCGGSGVAAAAAEAEVTSPRHATTTSSMQLRRASSHARQRSADLAQLRQDSAMFRTGRILEFSNDCPNLRAKVARVGQSVAVLERTMQRLVDVTRRYGKHGEQFSDTGRRFAEELAGLRLVHGAGAGAGGRPSRAGAGHERGQRGPGSGSESGAPQTLEGVVQQFGSTMEALQSYRDTLLESMEMVFAQPMEAFARREAKEARKVNKDVTRAREVYEEKLARYLALPNNAQPADVRAREAAAAGEKRRFELARFDQVLHLNKVEATKKFQLVERVVAALYAQLGFFHQCHEMVATLEPAMRKVAQVLEQARKEFHQEERIWNARRGKLERQLNRGFFPHRAHERRRSLSGSGAAMQLMFGEGN
eukprot:g6158.t1